MNSNNFATAIVQLEELLHPIRNNGYVVRFGVQVALNITLLILCALYLIGTIVENRRTGRPLALFKIQRVASGRFVVVNALVLLVVFNAVAAALMLALRRKLYTILYSNGSTTNMLVLAVQGWSPLILVAWAYSFGNIAAMMQIRTRDYGGPSRGAVIVYNIAFFGTLLVPFALCLPFCLLANARMNTLIRTARTALDLFRTFENSNSLPPLSDLQAVQKLQATIFECRNDVRFWVRGTLIVAAFISGATGISAGAAFWFVGFLKQFPDSNGASASRTPTRHIGSPEEPEASAENSDHEITFLGLGDPSDLDSQPHHQVTFNRNVGGHELKARAMSRATSLAPSMPGPPTSTNISFKRLSRDLLLSVPVVLLLSLYCFILSITSVLHVGERDEVWRELMYDGISWTSVVLIFIVASFLHNLLKYRHASINASPSRRRNTPPSLAGFRLSPTTPTTRWTCRSPSQGRFILKDVDGGAGQGNELEVIRSNGAEDAMVATFEIKAGQGSPLEIHYQEKPPSLRTSDGGEGTLDWLRVGDADEKNAHRKV